MRNPARLLLVALPLLAAATTAGAQEGVALKAHYLFNSSASGGADTLSLSDANGFGIGDA